MNYIPIFPEAIDNTMRKYLVKCQKSAFYRFELGLQSKQAKRVDLVAGKAFAKGIEVVRRMYFGEHHVANVATKAGVEALYADYGGFACPKDSNKSADRMAGALMYYLEKYPLDDENLVPLVLPDGTLALEISKGYPCGLTHPETGKGIEWVSNFDMLAVDLKDGGLWVVDEKTTSQMGEKWANQWPLDSQMTGYCWTAQKMIEEYGLPYELRGAVINGVAIKKYDYDCGRFKTYRPPWMIDRWFEQMSKDVSNWMSAHLFQVHDMALDHACAFYNNPCEFTQLCLSKQPEKLYEGSYDVEFWNPKDRK